MSNGANYVVRIRRLKRILLELNRLNLDSADMRERLMMLQAKAKDALADTRARGNLASLPYARIAARAKHRQIGQMTERRIRPIIKELRAKGFNTYRALAAELMKRKVTPPRSKQWNPTSVRNIELRHKSE